MADCAALLAAAAEAAGSRRWQPPRARLRSLRRARAARRGRGFRAPCRHRPPGDARRPRARPGRPRAGRPRPRACAAPPTTAGPTSSAACSSQRVEPHLGLGRPTILDRYPAPEAALARPTPGDPRTAERFELYCCGVELANGFGELTDAAEQRRRFETAMAARAGARAGGLPDRRGFPRLPSPPCRRPAASRSASTGW